MQGDESWWREHAAASLRRLCPESEERGTDLFDRFSALSNRALVIKVNRLLRL